MIDGTTISWLEFMRDVSGCSTRDSIFFKAQSTVHPYRGHVTTAIFMIGSIQFWIEHSESVPECLDPLLPRATASNPQVGRSWDSLLDYTDS